MPLSVFLVNPNEWQLEESGVIVADSSGFKVAGITIGSTTDISIADGTKASGIEITLASKGKNKNYELLGFADLVRIEHMTDETVLPNGSVSISTFSSEIDPHNFWLPNIDLTVPQVLPRHITTTAAMFGRCSLFNQPIGNWDMSNITSTRYMFGGCRLFNRPIGDWDMSQNTNMAVMFVDAFAFNQPIGNWDVGKVTTTNSTFARCSSFNQDLSMWNVSNVGDMIFMFQKCLVFNQDLSKWCVTKQPSPPSSFSVDTPNWVKPKPVWGTCPRGENLAA